MNIMLLGNTGSGKSTLAGLLASRHNFKHVNTGSLTRMMASFGCNNLPILVQDMIKTMSHNDNHIFDHFYMHTWQQLTDLFGEPVVVIIEDRRSGARDYRFMCEHHIIPIKVYNTDYGFDVSELIRADILPFDEFPMLELEPGEQNEK